MEIFVTLTMITFKSFKPSGFHSDYDQAEDTMDVDDENDPGRLASRITCPGEPLTSSQAFMRWAQTNNRLFLTY